jgi:hypothetical protein
MARQDDFCGVGNEILSIIKTISSNSDLDERQAVNYALL